CSAEPSSGEGEEFVVEELLRGGARGHLLKSDAKNHLIGAIERELGSGVQLGRRRKMEWGTSNFTCRRDRPLCIRSRAPLLSRYSQWAAGRALDRHCHRHHPPQTNGGRAPPER